MEEKIFIVSEKRDKYYDVSELVPNMMKIENVTEDWAINYFMNGLEGTRFMKFSKSTPTKVIYEWIIQDMGLKNDINVLN